MRIAIATLAGIAAATLLTPAAEAAPVLDRHAAIVQNTVPVAEGCGRGWHWVGGHRRRDGVWVPGHCVRN